MFIFIIGNNIIEVMKEMKKRMLILFTLILLIFTACAPGQQRPIEQRNEGSQELNRNLETALSAIYDPGVIQNARVITDTLDVKSGVGNNFSTIGTLKRNDVVKVLRQVENWHVIQLDDNQVGAIDAQKTTPVVLEGEIENIAQAQEPQELTQPQPNQELQQQENQQPDEPNTQIDRNQQPTEPNAQTPRNQRAAEPNAQAPTTTALGQQEQRMVDLVNQERTKNGLAPLIVDLEVARVAAIKSQDMADNNYFSHNSPTYGSPFDMLKKFNISYLHAGENLAGNSSVENAHTALMNSSGHRQNILSPDFTHIGIGVRPSSKYGYLYTQMFISKPK